MHGAHKAVEKAAVDAAVFKQLAHVFERVHRILHGLRGKAIHQVGMHHHARVGKAFGHLRHLLDRDAFFHELKQAVRRDFEATRHGDAAALCQQFAKLWREGFLKTDVAPPRDLHAPAQQLFGQGFQGFRGRGLVHKVKAGLARLGHDLLDAVDQGAGLRGFVAADVVQAHVTKAAFFPVAAVRHGELVPAPVAPQPVHRVEHVQQ